jgi:glycosyltransferase involved in cell wall biosynthesis
VSRRRLSIVIPTWNRARLVCEAVESALVQEGADLEVIVVDDGSTDGTAETIERRFGESVKLLRMPTRSGVGAARNHGVAWATGDLLSFLDSDDLWLPGKLRAELDVLERFPEADAIVSDSRFIANGQFVGTSRFADNGALAATGGRTQWVDDSPWSWTISSHGVSTCAITLCRSAVTRLGLPLFATDLSSCEDWELEVRLYQECRVVALPRAWSHVRWIDDGTRIGRACPGQPRSREQEMELLRCQLTVVERSIHPGRLTAGLAHELKGFRWRVATELSRLQAAPA